MTQKSPFVNHFGYDIHQVDISQAPR